MWLQPAVRWMLAPQLGHACVCCWIQDSAALVSSFRTRSWRDFHVATPLQEAGSWGSWPQCQQNWVLHSSHVTSSARRASRASLAQSSAPACALMTTGRQHWGFGHHFLSALASMNLAAAMASNFFWSFFGSSRRTGPSGTSASHSGWRHLIARVFPSEIRTSMNLVQHPWHAACPHSRANGTASPSRSSQHTMQVAPSPAPGPPAPASPPGAAPWPATPRRWETA